MARRRMSRQERLAAEAVGQMLATREGRRFLIIVAVVALVALGIWWLWQSRQAAPPPTPSAAIATGRPLRIATWNLRKFSEGANPDLVTIASIIKSAQFDILALQEVQRQGQAVERLRRQLNEPWRHAVSERTGNNERYAFLYRQDVVELLSGPTLLPGPEAPVFDRVPCIASFRCGQFDFTLVTVHLSYTDTARRRREAETLAQYARTAAERGPERDLIVLGDFNEQRPGYLTPFDRQAWKRLITEPTNLKSTEIYDNILIDPRYTGEWTGQSGVIRFDEDRFGDDDKRASDDVSDHRPDWAEFATGGPDDD